MSPDMDESARQAKAPGTTSAKELGPLSLVTAGDVNWPSGNVDSDLQENRRNSTLTRISFYISRYKLASQ